MQLMNQKISIGQVKYKNNLTVVRKTFLSDKLLQLYTIEPNRNVQSVTNRYRPIIVTETTVRRTLMAIR